MNLCLNCGHLFEDGEEKLWIECHRCGDVIAKEKFSGCPLCGESYIEVKHCALCGSYPAEEYDDNEVLPNGGICKECFDDGIKNHFMEYLDAFSPEMEQAFYLGIAFQYENGYAFTADQLLELCQKEYTAYLQSEYSSPKDIFATQLLFIMDNDPSHFSEWLINRGEKNANIT